MILRRCLRIQLLFKNLNNLYPRDHHTTMEEFILNKYSVEFVFSFILKMIEIDICIYTLLNIGNISE